LKLLCLDVASTTGWAYWDSASPKKVKSGAWDCGKIKLDESKDMRLLRMEANLNEMLELGIDLVLFECARSKGSKTQSRALIVQGELQGIVKRFCTVNNILYQGISPTTIKLSATGDGGASKQDMIAAAKTNFNKKIESEDEADALGLLFWGIKRYGSIDLQALKDVVKDAFPEES